MARLHLMPVEVAEQVFCFFERMRHAYQRLTQLPREQIGDQVAVRVVADDQVRPSTEFAQQLQLRVGGERF
jgi:hypothetical protein